jgi:hypothetical protein
VQDGSNGSDIIGARNHAGRQLLIFFFWKTDQDLTEDKEYWPRPISNRADRRADPGAGGSGQVHGKAGKRNWARPADPIKAGRDTSGDDGNAQAIWCERIKAEKRPRAGDRRDRENRRVSISRRKAAAGEQTRSGQERKQ